MVLGRRVWTVDSSERSEQPHHHYLPVPGRLVQGRPSVPVLCDYVGPVLKQQPRHRLVPVEEEISPFFNGLVPAHCCQAKGRLSVPIFLSLDVGMILTAGIEMVVPVSTTLPQLGAFPKLPSAAPSIRPWFWP